MISMANVNVTISIPEKLKEGKLYFLPEQRFSYSVGTYMYIGFLPRPSIYNKSFSTSQHVFLCTKNRKEYVVSHFWIENFAALLKEMI